MNNRKKVKIRIKHKGQLLFLIVIFISAIALSVIPNAFFNSVKEMVSSTKNIEASVSEPKANLDHAPNQNAIFKTSYPSNDVIALCLHKVDYSGDNFSISPQVFRHIIQELKNQGYVFVDVNDIRNINEGKMVMPKKAVFLGFDDGYKDNHDYAMPVLLEEGAKATFFIVSSFIGSDGWMTEEDIFDLIHHGFAIGSHTVDHANLTDMDQEQVKREFVQSKVALEQRFGQEIFSLAYPLGHENEYVMLEASKYYDLAFIAEIDTKNPETDMTVNRYGVFKWHKSIGDILSQQPAK